MNIYAIIGDGTYGGGLAIVAANNIDEAKELAHAAEHSLWDVDYLHSKKWYILPAEHKGDIQKVLIHFETGE